MNIRYELKVDVSDKVAVIPLVFFSIAEMSSAFDAYDLTGAKSMKVVGYVDETRAFDLEADVPINTNNIDKLMTLVEFKTEEYIEYGKEAVRN